MTKYYVGEIKELNGGMEYDTVIVFAVSLPYTPEKKMEQITQGWRGEDDNVYDKAAGGYWSDDSLISGRGFKEIPKEDFDVLVRYL